ncbi:FAD-binding oxidoreductase [Akkermansiaceae bacterium]|nr:FAD-binding oxidoreductase [Akkermansiaceae bacterium]MDB4537587.1 FAD-binding oxidoreductase [Akkermansiaceae bacterium]
MIEVVGFGLAGACVALQLQSRGREVRVVDDGKDGSTLVAAGLVNPVAGPNFEPSWEVAEAWAIALPFYRELEALSGQDLFHEHPILRLWRDEKDRAKFERKRDRLESWIEKVGDEGVTWQGGGWLDTRRFLPVAKEVFLSRGGNWGSEETGAKQIRCTGAAGLLSGEFPKVEHRSAKGEILTVRIPHWNESRILNRSGWVIPIGSNCYRVGATYEWDGLESGPTLDGRVKIEKLLKTFTDRDFEVIDHHAGIRPIINRSKPVVEHHQGVGWMVNGLGSKGVIYAPRVGLEMAAREV